MELVKGINQKPANTPYDFGVEEEDKQIRMSVDREFMEKYAADIFTKMYVNPEKAMVREMVSNARDAISAANNIAYDPNRKIRIEFHNSKWATFSQFVISDDGVGMSPTEVEEVYSQYKETGKVSDMSMIGCFGFGSKSPLAVVDSFTVRTVKDGVLTIAELKSVGFNKTCVIRSPQQVIEPNGTTVTIPIPEDKKNAITNEIATICEATTDNLLVVNGKEIPNSLDRLVFIGEGEKFLAEDGVHDGVKLYASSESIEKILSGYDTLSTILGEADIAYNVGGYPYKDDSRYVSASTEVVTMVAVTPIGALEFIRSRDAFTKNERFNEINRMVETVFMNNINRVFEEYVINRINEITRSENKYYGTVDFINRVGFGIMEAISEDAEPINCLNVELAHKNANGLNISPIRVDLSGAGILSDLIVKSVKNRAYETMAFVLHNRIGKTSKIRKRQLTPREFNSTCLNNKFYVLRAPTLHQAELDLSYGWLNYSGHTVSTPVLLTDSTILADHLVKIGGIELFGDKIRVEEKERRKAEAAKNPKQVNSSYQLKEYSVENGSSKIIDINVDDDFSNGLFYEPKGTRRMSTIDSNMSHLINKVKLHNATSIKKYDYVYVTMTTRKVKQTKLLKENPTYKELYNNLNGGSRNLVDLIKEALKNGDKETQSNMFLYVKTNLQQLFDDYVECGAKVLNSINEKVMSEKGNTIFKQILSTEGDKKDIKYLKDLTILPNLIPYSDVVNIMTTINTLKRDGCNERIIDDASKLLADIVIHKVNTILE